MKNMKRRLIVVTITFVLSFVGMHVINQLAVLFAQREKGAAPRQQRLTPTQQLAYRAVAERRFQAEYEKALPGVTVLVFMRNDQFVLLFQRHGEPATVQWLDVSDTNNPTVKLTGIIVKPPKVK